ncbi:MAG: EMC3/TMCO1 family protein [Nanobdellota archaeon]
MVYSSTFFDPVLNPLLHTLGPLWSMIIVSLFVALLTTVIYKYATNQEKMKSLKSSMKRYRKKISSAKDDKDKAMKLQKQMMKLNGEYMRHSFRSMIFTIVPVMLFLGWFAAHFAFVPILPGDTFNITAEVNEDVSGSLELRVPDNVSVSDNLTKQITNDSVVWTGVSGEKGEYDFSIYHNVSSTEEFFPVLITSKQLYAPPFNSFEEDSAVFSSIKIGMDKLLVFKEVPLLGSLPLIKKAGWLGAYILFSILFSTLFRKWFGVA